ncbi:unnamed protein product [Alternaria alternata]
MWAILGYYGLANPSAEAEKITYDREVDARVLNTPKKRKTSKKARGELKAELHDL